MGVTLCQNLEKMENKFLKFSHAYIFNSKRLLFFVASLFYFLPEESVGGELEYNDLVHVNTQLINR